MPSENPSPIDPSHRQRLAFLGAGFALAVLLVLALTGAALYQAVEFRPHVNAVLGSIVIDIVFIFSSLE